MKKDYKAQLETWQAEMDAEIREENSWLALAGLFWLEDGENTFGSDPASAVILPERAPAKLGVFEFDGQTVTLNVEDGMNVLVNGKQGHRSGLDAESVITLDGMQMIVIQRVSGTAIRLWDNQHDERRTFPARTWFPVNERFRIPAIYTPYSEPKTITQPDIFGNLIDGQAHGVVSFEFEGQACNLDVTQHEDKRLYIQFRDSTSGQGTYPSGRYYHTTDPVVDGQITLDFNYAYNPPCAVTPFATCNFAPEQNTLPFRVEAGETYTHHH